VNVTCPIHGASAMTTGGCIKCPRSAVLFPSVQSEPGPPVTFNTTSTVHPSRITIGRDSEDYVTVTTYDERSNPLTTIRMSDRLARWMLGELTRVTRQESPAGGDGNG